MSRPKQPFWVNLPLTLSQRAWQRTVLCAIRMVFLHQNTKLRLPKNNSIASVDDHSTGCQWEWDQDYITGIAL